MTAGGWHLGSPVALCQQKAITETGGVDDGSFSQILLLLSILLRLLLDFLLKLNQLHNSVESPNKTQKHEQHTFSTSDL